MSRDDEVETFYDGVAAQYHGHDGRVCDRILEHFLLANLPRRRRLRVLDAGGGIGRFSEPLVRKGHDVTLSDISMGMLKRAQKRLGKKVLYVRESVVDMKQQPAGTYDVVLMMNSVLDYCQDHRKAIREARRVLRRGGLFIGNVNNRFYYAKENELKQGDYRMFAQSMRTGDRYISWGGQAKGHMTHEFTLEELERALTRGGFGVKRLIGVFNLLGKYDHDSLKDVDGFIKLQIAYAQRPEYVKYSQDFFFVATR